ncbi:MAG: hypothetical protein E7418_05610 [Ruminococcaceae bacterium]|nr:hypothetical protein [Oscillospiraceae bacterium]
MTTGIIIGLLLVWAGVRFINYCQVERYDRSRVDGSKMLRDKIENRLTSFQAERNMLKGKYDKEII